MPPGGSESRIGERERPWGKSVRTIMRGGRNLCAARAAVAWFGSSKHCSRVSFSKRASVSAISSGGVESVGREQVRRSLMEGGVNQHEAFGDHLDIPADGRDSERRKFFHRGREAGIFEVEQLAVRILRPFVIQPTLKPG